LNNQPNRYPKIKDKKPCHNYICARLTLSVLNYIVQNTRYRRIMRQSVNSIKVRNYPLRIHMHLTSNSSHFHVTHYKVNTHNNFLYCFIIMSSH